jgi:ribokinase
MDNNYYDIITLGSATIDVFADTNARYIKEKYKGEIEEFITYPSGSKILINKLMFEIGGGGTNTAIGFSRLGLKTAWLGKVGNDENANKILEYLKNNKIDFLGTKGKGSSGYSIILDSVGHDRTILTHKGENNNLSFKELKLSKLKTKWFYFSSMMDKSFLTQKKLAIYAKKKGIKLAFNPSSYQADLGYKKLNSILKNSNVLILNLEEAELLLKEKMKFIESEINNIKENKNIIKNKVLFISKELNKLGPEIIVITNGSNGTYCLYKNEFYYVKPKKVKIVETTGAGDAFSSGFISALNMKNNYDINFALKLGSLNAESVITHHGAKNELLKIDTAKKLIRKNRIIESEIIN